MGASEDRKPSPLGERILAACEAEGRSPTRAERETGFSQGHLSRLIYGQRGTSTLDVEKFAALARYLHVNFEWLVTGSGPMRRGGRATTSAEEAIVFARRNGAREDAIKAVWERNRDREAELSVWDWVDLINAEARRLNDARVPRPEAVDDQRRAVKRTKRALEKARVAKEKADAEAEVAHPRKRAVHDV